MPDRILPEGYDELPFIAARGLPQTVAHAVEARSLRFTLLCTPADLPGLLSLPETELLVDPATEEQRRPAHVPATARSLLVRPSPGSLSARVVRVHLAVREGVRLLGCQPVMVGVPLTFGTTAASELVVDVVVADLQLRAGTLIRPGDVGSRILVGVRGRTRAPGDEGPHAIPRDDASRAGDPFAALL